MMAFICLKQTTNWTSCTLSPSTHKQCRAGSCARKNIVFPSEDCLHPFHILNHRPTRGETHQTISCIPVTCYKRFFSPPWLSVREPDFFQFVCLKERHFSGWSGGPAELLNPGLMEFLGWLLLRSLPFKATSARATASQSKTDGDSQIKHFASYLLQMYPSIIYQMVPCPFADRKHTCHIMSGTVCVCLQWADGRGAVWQLKSTVFAWWGVILYMSCFACCTSVLYSNL